MTLRLFARISSGAIIAASAAMLAALALGIPSLPPSLPPWSAVAFLVIGCALFVEELRPLRHPILLGICAASVLIIGSVSWGEYVLQTDIGFDRLLFPRLLLSTALHPGRPGPLAGFHFCLLGLMLLLLRVRRKAGVVVREFAAFTAISLSYFAFLRSLQYTQIGGRGMPETMAGTAAALALLAAATVLVLRPDGILIPLLRDAGPAGMIARGMMPVPLILLAMTDLLRYVMRRLGIYQAQAGAAIFSTIDILAALAIVLVAARKIVTIDRQRSLAEEELRRSRDELDLRVHLRTRELTEAQMELQHTNAMLGSLIEACPLAICAFDLDGSLRKSNTAAETMRLAGNDECRKLVTQAGLGEPVSGIEIACVLDGKEIHLNVWASPILTPGAGPDGVVLMAADVSDRKAIESQMRQAQKLESLGVLAGGIAHDFNNLLTGVLGHASLLRDRVTNPEGFESAEALLDAGHRMAKLTAQMLAYSGRGRFVISAIDLSQQVRQITSLLHASIPKNVRLVLSLAENLAAIEADTGQLQQVIMNLIINAAEAIGAAQGTVDVSTCLRQSGAEELQANVTRQVVNPGAYVALVVRDTGIGMDEQTQSRIFDPFYTTKFTGRGLGLSAVLGIVRAHRGALLVESQPGAGTTFHVLFPVAEAKQVPVDAPPAKMSRGRGLVLVVDDETAVRRTAEALLRAAGYETVSAADGQEALAVYAAMPDRIDAVLLDMTMPVMNGKETLARLLAQWPNAVVVATSGYDETEAQARLEHRATGFVQKPYTAAQLTSEIAAAIGKKREASANA